MARIAVSPGSQDAPKADFATSPTLKRQSRWRLWLVLAIVGLLGVVFLSLSLTVFRRAAEQGSVGSSTPAMNTTSPLNETTTDDDDDDDDQAIDEAPRQESWPEVMGLDATKAASYIQSTTDEDLDIVIVPEGYMVTADYQDNRVRLYVDGDQKVVQEPHIG